MIVAVSGELFALEIGFVFADGDEILFGTLQHGSEVFVILAGECFCGENDLMFVINTYYKTLARWQDLNSPVILFLYCISC
jgi:hypothetical protein